MIVLAVILAVVLLILVTRISVRVQYGADGFAVFAGVRPLLFCVFPKPKKEPKPKEKVKKPKEKAETGGAVDKLRAGLKMVKPIVRQVRKRLTISELTLHYTAAMDDAAMTALAYGGAHAAVSTLLPMIRAGMRVKKEDIRVDADFSGQADTVFVRVRISISVWGILCLGAVALREARRSGLLATPKQAEKEKVEA